MKCFMQEGKIKTNIVYSYYLMDRIANHLFTTWRFSFYLLLIFVLHCQNAKFSEAEDNNRVYCNNPGRVHNGRVYYFPPDIRDIPAEKVKNKELTEYPIGSTLEYYCKRDHWLQGSQNLICESDGYWSGTKPTCVKGCGQTFAQPRVRIHNGQETVYSEWPWMVSISLQEEDGSRFVCLGALLNSRSVVTAAHCLENGRTYVLRFGKYYFNIKDVDSDVLSRTSTRVIIHPRYSQMTMNCDIGLILFKPAIRYSSSVQPICLPTVDTTERHIVPGRIGYVNIFGDTEDEPLLAGFPVLRKKDCVRSYRKENLSVAITKNMFCAGYYNGTYSVCGADGGSPFVFYDIRSNRFILEGLASFSLKREGETCGLPGRYPIFTRVVRFLPWIHKNVQ